MLRRFYSEEVDNAAGTISLDRVQSSHAKLVLRLREGDKVSVFDGRGHEFECEISELNKKETRLRIIRESAPPADESPLELTLAASLLKNDKFDLVIQKGVELGVTRLVPLLASRTEIQARKAAARTERWEKIVIEASKQCGRATLMQIDMPAEVSDIASKDGDLRVVFAERGGESFPEIGDPGSVIAVVGPEGGWEENELQLLADAGFEMVTLGNRILRAETASITAAALLQHRYGDL